MNFRWYLARRVLWSVFVLWLVMTMTFVLFTTLPSNSIAQTWGLDPDEAREVQQSIRDQMNYDEPLIERYTSWMSGYLTLDMGVSLVQGRPVSDILGDSIPVTLAYLVPSILLSMLFGVVMGLYKTVGRNRVVRWVNDTLVYTWLAVPTFWIGVIALRYAQEELGMTVLYTSSKAMLSAQNVRALALPTILMTVSLIGIQARFTHNETAEYVGEDFVKTLRASGGDGLVLGRHLLRNAIVPLLSLFFTRTLTVLLLNIYVIEFVFDLPGLGLITLNAINGRDIGVMLGVVFVTVAFAVVGNLLQDVSYHLLDPRVSEDGR